MKSPEELLREALEVTGVTPTELGQKLGYKNAYQAVHSLMVGRRKFTPAKQREVAEILGLPRDHFGNPDKTKQRERYLRETFAAFLTTDIGARQSDEDRKLIERMGRQFTGDKVPTVSFFTQVALALEGNYTAQQLEEAVRENEALEAHNAAKPDERRGFVITTTRKIPLG